MQDKFYIKIKNIKTNQEGFLVDTSEISIATGFAEDIAAFNTKKDAKRYLKGQKVKGLLKSSNVSLNIVSTSDFKNDSLVSLRSYRKGEQPWTIVHNEDQYIHYSIKEEGYFFGPEKIGACCWRTEEECNAFIAAYTQSFAKEWANENKDIVKDIGQIKLNIKPVKL